MSGDAPAGSVAVVGGGLAGLAAAWWLGATHRVTLYERQARPGFVASAVAVPLAAGGRAEIDVPLRVFYPGYYPSLVALYADAGVPTEPVSYATSFCDADGSLYFRFRNLRLGPRSWSYVLPQDLAGARARRLLAAALRFRREGARALAAGRLEGTTLGAFVRELGLPEEFVRGLLLPVTSTIATCPDHAALEFPAAVVVDYLQRGITRQSVRRACEGAAQVVERLRARVALLRTSAAPLALRRHERGVTVQLDDGRQEEHAHVVLACNAAQALALLGESAGGAERVALGLVQHHPIEVLTHRDERLMPARRADWSAVNAFVHAAWQQPMASVWINAVQPVLRAEAPVFQTVAPAIEPREALVIGRARFERPVVTLASLSVPSRIAALHAEPGRRVWFCGSYAAGGVPLLEAAVASGRAAAAAVAARMAPGTPLRLGGGAGSGRGGEGAHNPPPASMP